MLRICSGRIPGAFIYPIISSKILCINIELLLGVWPRFLSDQEVQHLSQVLESAPKLWTNPEPLCQIPNTNYTDHLPFYLTLTQSTFIKTKNQEDTFTLTSLRILDP